MAVEINLKTLSAAKPPVGNQLTQLPDALLLLLSCSEALITKFLCFTITLSGVFFSGRYNLGFEQFRARTRVEIKGIRALGFGERKWKDKLTVTAEFGL